MRPTQRTAVRGLALAGDWTHTVWTTTMEGARPSAARAVEAVLTDAFDGRDVSPRRVKGARRAYA